MDLLSDVLEIVRLKGSIYFTANFYHPWAFASPSGPDLLRSTQKRAESVALFHIVTEGSCWFQPDNGAPVLADPGSIVIFPHGCAHKMSSDVRLDPVFVGDLFKDQGIEELTSLEYGGKGKPTRFICGYLLCDQRFKPLLGALPDLLVVKPKKVRKKLKEKMSGLELSNNSMAISSDRWLDITTGQLTREVTEGDQGSNTIRTRLTELMYVEVLRKLMKSLPEKSTGWLAAVRDPQIGKALKQMHDTPSAKWSVENLAKNVGVSRSAFAQRFTGLVGESPMQYLTHWRMQIAKNLLSRPDLSLLMVAERVGYESDIAFCRAFKRIVGMPPAQWKKQENSPGN